MTKKTDYKKTLNLPRTEFPMKANLPVREPETLKKWYDWDVYGKITQARRTSEKKFVLHDGPPYANGNIHMGHVLNKILKDICVKFYAMRGYHAPYVPGWDCHGLPVEHQLFKEMDVSKHAVDRVDFRKKAHDYAMKFVKLQTEEFKRLGIFGDWDHPYLTLDKGYESAILECLADLYSDGYVYKDLKPVNWCMSCETALAEAEVEYHDKKSPSIYFKFEAHPLSEGPKTHFIVWTTTPWTIPANVAVAVHPDLLYSFVSSGDEIWIIASELVPKVMDNAGVSQYTVTAEKMGRELAEKINSCRHPFFDRDSDVVLAEYVTKEEGTGCVHIAPGHGQDDYFTAKKYGLAVRMPVDEKGCFTSEAPEFAGLPVYDANNSIIQRIRDNGKLVFSENVEHSYPHCWRCRSPIIFRATRQWFLNIDHAGLRQKMREIIENDVEWVPGSGRERIGTMVSGRPDWCLSRQRYWGVPIPAFRCSECRGSFTEEKIIRKVAELTLREGANVWFERSVEDLIPPGTVCPDCGSARIEKEDDILDVWFDSGVSHVAVLSRREELKVPADLYLEGSDQHRGWFQSSLITSAAMTGKAPYRKVITHGFVVDGSGKKMSKSLGNVISPSEVMKKYGADILRLWVASSDYEGDIKLSGEILERLADGYRKIRNTLRFLLSNLYDFDISKNEVPPEKMPEIDRWMLSKIAGITREVSGFYDKWEFHKVYRRVYDLCVYEVSAVYLDILKDSLYILAPGSDERRAHQTVIFRVLDTITRIMAPILCFTAEEVWSYFQLPGKSQSVHMESWPEWGDVMSEWEDEALDTKWGHLLVLRDVVMKFLEVERSSGVIGSSLEAAVFLSSEDRGMMSFLSDNLDKLSGLFKVSQVELPESPRGMSDVQGMPVKIKIGRAKGQKCPRCWNYGETSSYDPEHPELCQRCRKVVPGKA